MPAAAYYSWDKLGRPLDPARPIREVVERLNKAYPRAAAAHLFSWYANEAHYQAVPPQDHTPFSQTGWPLPSPQWWVFATDVMHRPDLGVDCNLLFPYWLAEAKAGRMPWLKYLIWRAQLYDVRNRWAPQANSGHFDHIHLSARTDHQYTSLGSWSITPEDDMEQRDRLAYPTAVDGRTVGNHFADSQNLRDWWYGKPGDKATTNPPPPGSRADLLLGTLAAIKQQVDQIAAALAGGLPTTATVTLSGGSLADIRQVVDEELDEQSRGGVDTDPPA